MVLAIVICKKCRVDVRLGKERFDGKRYLCENCYRKVRNLDNKELVESPAPADEKKEVNKKPLPEDDKEDRRYSPVDPDDL
jgi:BioD-like phosphotransacetylase family protein